MVLDSRRSPFGNDEALQWFRDLLAQNLTQHWRGEGGDPTVFAWNKWGPTAKVLEALREPIRDAEERDGNHYHTNWKRVRAAAFLVAGLGSPILRKAARDALRSVLGCQQWQSSVCPDFPKLISELLDELER